MKIRHVIAMSVALSVSATAFAADNGEALFKKSKCTSCHALNNKVVGPALKAVAAKYKGDAGAQARLEKKIRTGGAGSFGSVPMPAAPKSLSDTDIQAITKWVLSLS